LFLETLFGLTDVFESLSELVELPRSDFDPFPYEQSGSF
jgi:hypothetical protein